MQNHTIARFNGAATLQLRKLHDSFNRLVALERFNGAATLQLRKPVTLTTWNGQRMLLQWGPQLCSCGNSVSGAGFRIPYSELQWGRNFAVAETDAGIPVRRPGQELQWGRNFAVAETSGRYTQCGQTHRFNGAATLQLRKRMQRVPMETSSSMLQWGRNFAVAETGRRADGRPVHLGASMGPQLCSCGNPIPDPVPWRRGRASMGPQLCSCGNGCGWQYALIVYGSFNGAATLQLRKQRRD